MISNNIQNKAVSFIEPTTAPSQSNDLGDKPLNENDTSTDFQQIANNTITATDKEAPISTEDATKIYQTTQAVIKKLENYNTDENIEITEEDVTDFKDIYLLVLNTVQTQVEDKIDNLTKEIAYLDLSSVNGIEDILTKADLIEGFRELEQATQEGLTQLNTLINPEDSQTTNIDQGLMQDIKFQVNNFMKQQQDTILENRNLEQSTNTLPNNTNFSTIPSTITLEPTTQSDMISMQDLQELKVISYKEAPSINLISPDNTPEEPQNTPAQETELLAIEPQSTEESGALVIEDKPTNHNASHSDSSSPQNQFGAAFANQALVNLAPTNTQNVKIETVNINDLSNYLQDQIETAPTNQAQEIRLQITPDSVGKIDLVITKNEHNEVTVEMSFHSKAGLETIKHELKDAIAELREVLKSKDLDLSKFEVKESSSSHTSYDGSPNTGSSNQAREQQKHKLQNTIPEWVKQKESSSIVSFKEIIEGI